jgi:hypothetical protein
MLRRTLDLKCAANRKRKHQKALCRFVLFAAVIYEYCTVRTCLHSQRAAPGTGVRTAPTRRVPWQCPKPIIGLYGTREGAYHDAAKSH